MSPQVMILRRFLTVINHPPCSRILHRRMCIAAWVWQSHPVYKLLLLFNRDEFHHRPADPVAWWGGSDGKILAGRDLQAGGTWLGCTKGGRVAFLTNVRAPDRRPDLRSRGELPRRFLESKKTPLDFADEIVKEADHYNGFNLVLADISEKDMVYITNRPKGKPTSVKLLSPGFYVLSNGTLDTPWPKTERLRKNFEELIGNNGENEIVAAEVFEKLMRDSIKADRELLQYTGCDPELEHKMSSIYVEFETEKGVYGTRNMSVLAVKRNGDVSMYERYLEADVWKEKTVQFSIENDAVNE